MSRLRRRVPRAKTALRKHRCRLTYRRAPRQSRRPTLRHARRKRPRYSGNTQRRSRSLRFPKLLRFSKSLPRQRPLSTKQQTKRARPSSGTEWQTLPSSPIRKPGKNTLHVVSLNSRGAIVLREKVSRGRIASRLANLPPCLIGIEAGLATHYVARELAALGRVCMCAGPRARMPVCIRSGFLHDQDPLGDLDSGVPPSIAVQLRYVRIDRIIVCEVPGPSIGRRCATWSDPRFLSVRSRW